MLDTETVEVGTIDEFLATEIEGYADRRIFLKMDTQGYDLKAFNGARGSICAFERSRCAAAGVRA